MSMGTKTQQVSFARFTMILKSDWSAGELLDTQVFLKSNEIPSKTILLCTIAGSDIKNFVRTWKLMMSEFPI